MRLPATLVAQRQCHTLLPAGSAGPPLVVDKMELLDLDSPELPAYAARKGRFTSVENGIAPVARDARGRHPAPRQSRPEGALHEICGWLRAALFGPCSIRRYSALLRSIAC